MDGVIDVGSEESEDEFEKQFEEIYQQQAANPSPTKPSARRPIVSGIMMAKFAHC